ncbi:hypothetical protein CJF42_22645 [Pseudoalteromonas sp. NBT06-2]|nr:hypothetical protein CJF42_22645 [Pseudoalteromonas sp. NBT06-2]
MDAKNTRKDYITDTIIKRNPDVVGIYRLIMKVDSDNFRTSSIQNILKCIKAKSIEVIIFARKLNDAEFLHSKVLTNLIEFKKQSDVIIANRMVDELNDVASKVYTRDLFGTD